MNPIIRKSSKHKNVTGSEVFCFKLRFEGFHFPGSVKHNFCQWLIRLKKALISIQNTSTGAGGISEPSTLWLWVPAAPQAIWRLSEDDRTENFQSSPWHVPNRKETNSSCTAADGAAQYLPCESPGGAIKVARDFHVFFLLNQGESNWPWLMNLYSKVLTYAKNSSFREVW